MSTDLAPIPKPALPADAWAKSADALDAHALIRGRIGQSDLERMEAEFLASGGLIQQIPPGSSGLNDSQFNSRIVAYQITKAGPHTIDQRVEHEHKRQERIYSGDAELVAKVASSLPACKQKRDLAAACACSDDRVQRILRTYFADDPIAQPFMRKSRDATPAQRWNNPGRPATRESSSA